MERCACDGRQSRAGGDHLGVEHDLDQCALRTRQGRQQGRLEVFGAIDAHPDITIGLRQGREVGVVQVRAHVVRGKVALLVHAYGAVHAVVQKQHNGFGTVLHCRSELLTIH